MEIWVAALSFTIPSLISAVVTLAIKKIDERKELKDIQKKLDNVSKSNLEAINKLELKLDEHIAESYRNVIFSFQKRILKGEVFTSEEWNDKLETCDAYNTYCIKNKVQNGKAKRAIQYIKAEYKTVLEEKKFLDLPLLINE